MSNSFVNGLKKTLTMNLQSSFQKLFRNVNHSWSSGLIASVLMGLTSPTRTYTYTYTVCRRVHICWSCGNCACFVGQSAIVYVHKATGCPTSPERMVVCHMFTLESLSIIGHMFEKQYPLSLLHKLLFFVFSLTLFASLITESPRTLVLSKFTV